MAKALGIRPIAEAQEEHEEMRSVTVVEEEQPTTVHVLKTA